MERGYYRISDKNRSLHEILRELPQQLDRQGKLPPDYTVDDFLKVVGIEGRVLGREYIDFGLNRSIPDRETFERLAQVAEDTRLISKDTFQKIYERREREHTAPIATTAEHFLDFLKEKRSAYYPTRESFGEAVRQTMGRSPTGIRADGHIKSVFAATYLNSPMVQHHVGALLRFRDVDAERTLFLARREAGAASLPEPITHGDRLRVLLAEFDMNHKDLATAWGKKNKQNVAAHLASQTFSPKSLGLILDTFCIAENLASASGYSIEAVTPFLHSREEEQALFLASSMQAKAGRKIQEQPETLQDFLRGKVLETFGSRKMFAERITEILGKLPPGIDQMGNLRNVFAKTYASSPMVRKHIADVLELDTASVRRTLELAHRQTPPPEEPQTGGEALRHMMAKLCISPPELASAAGISVNSVHHYMMGKGFFEQNARTLADTLSSTEKISRATGYKASVVAPYLFTPEQAREFIDRWTLPQGLHSWAEREKSHSRGQIER